jgi:hypothetical protein
VKLACWISQSRGLDVTKTNGCFSVKLCKIFFVCGLSNVGGVVVRIKSILAPCVLSMALTDCGNFANPNAWPQKFNFGDSKTLALGPDIRLVTERERDVPGQPPQMVMCTEPSPDVAIAFGTTLAATANFSQTGEPTVAGTLNAGSTEAATALAGRTAGVLALRDGLYAACQAYTNGVLGQDAYALVLSQYGNLLVALAAPSGDATGPTGATGAAGPTGPSAKGATGAPGSPGQPGAASPTAQPRTPGASGPSGGKGPGGKSGNPALYTPADSAMAALIVGCITEYDPTRSGAFLPNGQFYPNPMLSRELCQKVLTNVAKGKLYHP